MKYKYLQTCTCNWDKASLKAQGAMPQVYREIDGKTVLLCTVCDHQWDHKVTDMVIDLVMKGEWA
jgi:hypothetical protein